MNRFLRIVLVVGLLVVALAVVLFAYFLYAPAPEPPPLTGNLTRGAIEAGGRERTYLTYVPHGLPKGAALVVALHGSGENGAHMRIATGYGFDRLADEHGFAVVYPDAYGGHWNGCNRVGDYESNRLDIDDVAYLTGLVDTLQATIGIDPDRVFATGISRGGAMALRLALEAPSRFRAVAAVSANVPTPENFKCRPAAQGTASVLILNGTKDPLNPFAGGEVKFFGGFRRGKVRSSRESARYFAELDHLTNAPQTSTTQVAGGVRVERVLWRGASPVEVELVAVHGGGHGIPQPYWRYPRLLGPTPKEPNGPALIWAFFERQPASLVRTTE